MAASFDSDLCDAEEAAWPILCSHPSLETGLWGPLKGAAQVDKVHCQVRYSGFLECRECLATGR